MLVAIIRVELAKRCVGVATGLMMKLIYVGVGG